MISLRRSATALLVVGLCACSSSSDSAAPDDSSTEAATTAESPPSAMTVEPNNETTPDTVVSTTEPSIDDLDPQGGVDGPVIYWRQRPPGDSISEMAEIVGTLVREGDCLFVDDDQGFRATVLWEFGTRWIDERSLVELPDGTAIAVGADMPQPSGGGYHSTDGLSNFSTSDQVIAQLRTCDESGEVAVVQS